MTERSDRAGQPEPRQSEISDLSEPDDADVTGGATIVPCVRPPSTIIPCVRPGLIVPCVRPPSTGR